MSARLRHSASGYRRLLQISQIGFFVVVEGRIDRFFAAELCTVALARHGVQFDVRMAAELPNATGGKPGALEFYDTVRRRKELISDFKGKRTVIAFLLDKDVDDITRAKRRSQHVIYTEGYEVENYLFRHGDVVRSVAAVVRIPRTSVPVIFSGNWREVAAEAWRDWVTLCLLVQMLSVNAPANYGVASRINAPCLAPPDTGEFARRKRDILTRSKLPSATFETAFRRAAMVVARRYKAGRHDDVFRGKWYFTFVRHWVSTFGSTWRDDDLISALLTTIDAKQGWSAALVQAIEDLARQSGLVTAA